jgi:hypothetical protein
MVSRRSFLATTTVAAAGIAAGCRPHAAATGGAPNASTSGSPGHLDRLGVGLFTVPKSLDQDFDGTLAMIAGLGYKEVEFFGPYSFSVQSGVEHFYVEQDLAADPPAQLAASFKYLSTATLTV